MALRHFIAITRLDKPVGIWLLWWPTCWALLLANQGRPSPWLLILFFAGTLLMRSAGCIMNDLADRNFDGLVQRTRDRVLPSGKMQVKEALILLAILLFLSLLILLQLPLACWPYALFSVAISAIYPLCKRWIQAPQLVLGLAFSMGMPMAYVASAQSLDLAFWLLLLINYLWIVVYDSMYAMADREDDLQIGIHSTAILFGEADRLILSLLSILMQSLWLILPQITPVSSFFYLCWLAGGFILFSQLALIWGRARNACFMAFKRSVYYGFIMTLAILF